MESVLTGKRQRKHTLFFTQEKRLHVEKCVYDRSFNGNQPGDSSDTNNRIKKQKAHYTKVTGDKFYQQS